MSKFPVLYSLPNVKDFSVPSNDRTLFLMHLNLAAYPSCSEGYQNGHKHCTYSDESLQQLWTEHQSLYGPNITNHQEEIDSADQFHQDNWNLLLKDPQMKGFQKHSIPSTTAEFQVGVQALEWITSDAIILTFRGTYSKGDYENIDNWMLYYLIEKSTERMKEAWIEDAQLNWTDVMESRSSGNDDRYAKAEIRAVQTIRQEKYAQTLVDAVKKDKALSEAIDGLTIDEVHDTGYWKLTKYLVDQVAAKAKSTGKQLILTGHSQGGTRAQLASMYLHFKTKVEVPTLTFAATGSACVARLLFHHSSNLLADVNPYVAHSHLTDIVHPLDPWGNAMLGMDNGKVCYWGRTKTDSQNGGEGKNSNAISQNALQYCSKVYGWRGPTIIAAQEGAPLSGAGSDAPELAHNFKRCRYYTHSAEGMLLGLYADARSSSSSLSASCHEVPVIPVEDPEGQCPSGNMSKDEEQAMIVFGVIAVVFLVFLCCSLGCLFCRGRRGCCGGAAKDETHHLLSEIDGSEALSMEEPYGDDDDDVDENGIELL